MAQRSRRLGNLNPIFRKRDKSEDIDEISKEILKLARKTGALNLSGRTLATVPDSIYDINEGDKGEVTLDLLVMKDEEAWWNQIPITNLDLSCNTLTEISPKIEKLSSLTTLKLFDNNLQKLPAEIGKLEKLTHINLSRNKLIELPIEFFSLPDLRTLNLSKNLFNEIHPAISDLHMLQQLDLSNNNLQEIPSGIGFLVRLTELILNNNHIKQLPPDLVSLRCLQKLDLCHNDLIELPSDFGALRKLQFLYVSHNDIKNLVDFEGNDDLEELYMSNNFITDFPENFFTSLVHLKVLEVRDNKLTIIPEEIALLQNLVRLDITNNSVANLPYSLATLAHLNNLKVEGNPIKTIRREIIQCGTVRILKTLRERLQAENEENQTKGASNKMGGDGLNSPRPRVGILPGNNGTPDKYNMRKTHCLSLTMQGLDNIPDELFATARVENVSMVDFSKNNLQVIPTGLEMLTNCCNEVVLSHNDIEEVAPFISQFSRLTLLNLSRNRIKTLPKEISALKTLRELNISSNRFEIIPECVYELQGLEILCARDNRISVIDASASGLGAMSRLANLNLRNNNIQHVPPILGNLKNITTLDIVGNPFRQPRHQILEKGTDVIMSYLRDRIPA